MAEILQHGTGHRLAGEGGDRARHRDGVGADRDATAGATPKTATQRTLAGSSIQRIDIPDKVFARPRFIHDQVLAGMLHGRVLRPEHARAKLSGLMEDGARSVAGLIAIVRDGSFAGVVTETEHAADLALQALHKGATWSDGEPLPDESDLASFLKAQPSESLGHARSSGLQPWPWLSTGPRRPRRAGAPARWILLQ